MTARKLSLIVLLVLIVVFVIAVVTAKGIGGMKGVKIVDRSIITIDLSGQYPEYVRFQLNMFGMSNQLPFYKLIRSVHAAAEDDDVDAILLKGYCTMGLSRSWELAQALRHFKKRGKTVYGYFEIAGAANLMLSSLCDTTAMPEQGEWIVPGLAAKMLFLKGTFDKLGIGFDVVQHGKYKDAAEMLAKESMSKYMRESYNKLLDDLFGQFTEDCANDLEMSVDSITGFIDSAIFVAYDAREFGIVDTVMFWQDFKNHLVGEEDERLVSISKFARKSPSWDKCDKTIALVIAEGNISSSSGRWGEGITSKKYAKLLRELAQDDDIDAIVMRVNSPGGSALISDNIHREVAFAAAKKPFYVSMSSVAASGGYYISMAADTIAATPYTITGSIGVIMLKPNFSRMYEKIAANPQTLKRGKFADIFAGDHPMNDGERAILQKNIDGIYDLFVSKAAAGRDTSFGWIDAVAQGRIWTAVAAESLALIDETASLWDVIAMAEKAIEVPEGEHATIIIKPRAETFWEIAQSFSETTIASYIPKILREELEMYEMAHQLSAKPLYLWLGKIECGENR